SLGNSSAGVDLTSSGTIVGGASAGAGNLISGSASIGVIIRAGSGILVQGNFIGTDITGTQPLGNAPQGVRLVNASSIPIGGPIVAARNIISANGAEGVRIETGSGNVVQGNFIGTDVTGTTLLGNNGDGVDALTSGTLIGGASISPGSPPGNLISGSR